MDEELAAAAKRVWWKYGHDPVGELGENVYAESDWTEWRDLGDALLKYYPDLRPNENDPCKFGYERHDVRRCVTHGGYIDEDSYSDFYRETSEGYTPDFTSRPDTPNCTNSPKYFANRE